MKNGWKRGVRLLPVVLSGLLIVGLTVGPAAYVVVRGMLMHGRLDLSGLYQLLFLQPTFLTMFWNAVLYLTVIVTGQLLVAIPAAYAFARMEFPGRNVLYFLCVVLLLMPTLVTLVPNYIVLNWFGLLDTRWSIVLPGIFSAFGVCFLRQSMLYLPQMQFDSAELDGARLWQLIVRIVLPQIKGGISAFVLLSAIDCWNMVEQPLIFLNSVSKKPLSVYLSEIGSQDNMLVYAAGILSMLPMILFYALLQKEFLDTELVMGVKL